MLEFANGSLRVWPGKDDGWQQASGQLYTDWALVFAYYADARAKVSCQLHTNCALISCPAYTYTRVNSTLHA